MMVVAQITTNDAPEMTLVQSNNMIETVAA
jgi:hypothetical protein